MTNKLTRFARWYLTKQINAISYIGLRKHFLKVNDFEKYFLNRNGLEIGGPSQVFTDKGIFPIYRLLNNLDGCNFTNETVWEGSISEGVYDFYPGKTGRQFICEGSSLVFAMNSMIFYYPAIASSIMPMSSEPCTNGKEWSGPAAFF